MRVQVIVGVLVAGLTVAVSAQVLDVKKYGVDGHATEAIMTPDGQHVLVTVNGGRGESSVEVFTVQPNGGLKKTASQSMGSAGGAQGIVLIPGTHFLAVGLSDAGVAFLPLEAALEGKAKPVVLPQGEGSGSGYLAVSPDGQMLYVANEYGQGGNIGVIALHRDDAGRIQPEAVVRIPTPRATPGVTITPDGKRVYAVGEIARPDLAERVNGHDMKELRHDGCVQGKQGRSQPNGMLYPMDATQMATWKAGVTDEQIRAAAPFRGWFDAGCSPVRSAVSPDGTRLYVTARGDNRVLVFDTAAMASDPAHAFLAAMPSGGEAPVGVAVFDGGRKLLVANSNRFAGGDGNATVLDVTDPAHAKVLQTIKTGEFPRNISVSPDGKTLLLTVFLAEELLVLRVK